MNKLMRSKISKRAMGWFVAILFIAPVIVLLVNISFFSPKNDAEKYVAPYISNSVEIDINVSEDFLEINDPISIRTGIRQVFQRVQLQNAVCKSFTIYGSDYGKYFTVVLVGTGNSIHVQFKTFYSLVPGAFIRARVNKDDLDNPNYGTKEKPIPVLMLDIPSQRGWKDYDEEAITEDQYGTAVYYYLSYIMSEEEFKQRFK